MLVKPKPRRNLKKLAHLGNLEGDILIVLDPRVVKSAYPEANKYTSPLSASHGKLLAKYREFAGILKDAVAIVSAASPVDEEVWHRERVLAEAIAKDRDSLLSIINTMKPKLIIPMGKSAARQVIGKAVKITKIRGQPYYDQELDTIILPTLGPAHVARRPEDQDLFSADMSTAAAIVRNNYVLDYNSQVDEQYEWCFDLTPHMSNINQRKLLAVDCEWTSYGDGPGEWYNPKTKLLTVQLCYEDGHALVIPIDYNHPELDKPEPWKTTRFKLIKQLRNILQDNNIKKTGHNFKGDWLMLKSKLKITTRNYSDDTLLMVHAIDENMLNKSQDDCVRRWVPAMAGYNNDLNRDPEHVGKTRMDLLSPDKMLKYSGGDADANFRLYNNLGRIIEADKQAYTCYKLVPMAANIAFCDLEQEGFTISIDALDSLEKHLENKLYKEGNENDPNSWGDYKRLMRMIPASIRREYENTGVGLKLTRTALLQAMLFTHEDGLKIKPLIFTKSTAKLRDESKRTPSTSSKQALPYYKGRHPFIDGLMDFLKDEHLLTANVRAFHKYIFNQWVDTDGRRFGKIHPSYLLHGTVTGRTSSKNPNGQNFPKRAVGARKSLVKLYRSIFVAPPGYVLIEADFSQIELKLVAIASRCKAMLKVYRDGGDIHSLTAANVMGISLERFMRLKNTDPATWEHKRFQAKAINFGFIYGMGWRKFMAYSRTEYDLVFTEYESQDIRAKFFGGFEELSGWQEESRAFAKRHSYVRAFDGRKRHLPSVTSDDDQISSGAERQGINSPIQGFANDLGLMAISRINAEVPRDLVRLCGFVHDAIIAVAPKEHAIEAARIVKQYMETNPLDEWFGFKSPIPLTADVSVSETNLAELHELGVLVSDMSLVSWDDYNIQTQAQTFAVKAKPRPRGH